MSLSRTTPLGFLAAALLLTGCDNYLQDNFQPEYVVEAYLVAGEPMPQIRLSTTAPVREHYRFEDYGVSDAEVTVTLLGSEGASDEAYSFAPASPGVFVPTGNPIVQPERTYRLDVRIPSNGTTLRSTTRVPGLFEIVDLNTDTLSYQGAQQLEATVRQSAYPGRQSIYAFTVVALDTVSYGLTPLFAGIVENDDDHSASDFARHYSGLVNERNFDYDAEGNLILRLPWVALAFFGPNEIIASAVDDNMYDFLRSLDAMPPTPGQIENVITNVEGGRGIFGSMAEASARVFVHRLER